MRRARELCPCFLAVVTCSGHVFIKSCTLGTHCAPSGQNTKPSIAGGIIREQEGERGGGEGGGAAGLG